MWARELKSSTFLDLLTGRISQPMYELRHTSLPYQHTNKGKQNNQQIKEITNNYYESLSDLMSYEVTQLHSYC